MRVVNLCWLLDWAERGKGKKWGNGEKGERGKELRRREKKREGNRKERSKVSDKESEQESEQETRK